MATSSRDSMGSSPDLLANSVNDRTSSPVRDLNRITAVTPKKATNEVHGNVKLQDFYLDTPSAGIFQAHSPTRSVKQTESHISPWRIRVRVEAEREGQNEDPNRRRATGSPSKRSSGATRTILVPLKDGDDTPQTGKRGRGRPRKTSGTPAKRPGTPKPTKSRKIPSQGEAGNEEANIETSPKKRGPGRPRKGSTRRLSSLVREATDTDAEKDRASSSRGAVQMENETPRRKNTRGRRKTLAPVDIAVDSEASLSDNVIDLESGESQMARRASSGGPDQIDSGQIPSPRYRNPGGASTKSPLQPRSSLSPQKGRSRVMQSKSQNLDPDTHDPTEEHGEYDSIMESENFTMVSLSSLPSAQQHLQSSLQTDRTQSSSEHKKPLGAKVRTSKIKSPNTEPASPYAEPISSAPRVTYPRLNAKSSPGPSVNENQSTSSSNQASDQSLKQQTPSQPYSSPKLPPPVLPASVSASPRAVDKPTGATPKLVRVVRTGIALQGILDTSASVATRFPGRSKEGNSSATLRSPLERMDDLFSGFGVNTRRELRAGLRLGEELAKRQKLANKAASSVQAAADDVFQETIAQGKNKLTTPDEDTYILPALRAPDPVDYPTLPKQQLPSPDDSLEEGGGDTMDWQVDSPNQNATEAPAHLKATVSTANEATSEPITNATMLERQAEWQREREAVSREINEASTSQVIVLQSDDTASDLTDGEDSGPKPAGDDMTTDIWQIEAKSSSRLEDNMSLDDPRALFPENVIKPRRSKLPTPWRKKQVVYSDEIEPAHDSPDLPSAKHGRSPITPTVNKRARYLASDQSVLSEFADHGRSSTRNTGSHGSPKRHVTSGVPDSVEQRVRQRLLGDRWKGPELEIEQKEMSVKSAAQPATNSSAAPTTAENQVEVRFTEKANVTGKAKPRNLDDFLVQGGPLSQHKLVPRKASQPLFEPPTRAASPPANKSLTESSLHPSQTSSYLADYSPPNLGGKSWLTQLVPINLQTWFLSSKSEKQQQDQSQGQELGKQQQGAEKRQQPPAPPSRPSHGVHKTTSQRPPPPLQKSSILKPKPTTHQPIHQPKPPTEPVLLTKHLPFTKTHYTRLLQLYTTALQTPTAFPLSPTSPSRPLLKVEIESRGWRKRLAEWELGVVDAFMDILNAEGIVIAAASAELAMIDRSEVSKRVFSLWAGRVQRGLLELREGRAGEWDERFAGRREEVLRAQRVWLEKNNKECELRQA